LPDDGDDSTLQLLSHHMSYRTLGPFCKIGIHSRAKPVDNQNQQGRKASACVPERRRG
jgi:hypothetical protein